MCSKSGKGSACSQTISEHSHGAGDHCTAVLYRGGKILRIKSEFNRILRRKKQECAY